MNTKPLGRWLVIGAALLAGLLAVSLVTRMQSKLGTAPNEVHAANNQKTEPSDNNREQAEGVRTTREPGGAIKPSLASLDHAKNPFFSSALAAVRVRERQAAEQARIEAEALKQAEAEAMREEEKRFREEERRIRKEEREAERAARDAEREAIRQEEAFERAEDKRIRDEEREMRERDHADERQMREQAREDEKRAREAEKEARKWDKGKQKKR